MDRAEERRAYLAQIATKYYDQDKTQQEIADEMGLTRSAVSRLLTEARSKGVVEIIVHDPRRTSPELEQALRERFRLKAVRVLVRGSKSYRDMLVDVGILAAEYLTSIIQPTDCVGISWGTGLHEMLAALRPMNFPNVEVVQLVGGTGSEPSSTVGPLLAPRLADLLGGRCRYLHAPLIVESEVARDALLQERSVRETLARGAQANIALVGIGSTQAEIYNPYRLGYVSDEELAEIRASGAIGLVCGRHYNIAGQVLDISINRRVVGIELSALAAVDKIIGVAGGTEKGEAILGALLGRHVNVLFTDETAARRVIELHRAAAHANGA
ncbi:MAG: sugar-binding transcriptional regulator [Anaerolineae bacterium]